jgi:hypothetical protein
VHPRREARGCRVLSPIRILLTSPPPPALGRNERKGAKAQRRKGRGSRAEIRLLGFSPEGGTSLPVCVSHRPWCKQPDSSFASLRLCVYFYETARLSLCDFAPLRLCVYFYETARLSLCDFAPLRLCVYFSETAWISTGDPLPNRLIPQMFPF